VSRDVGAYVRSLNPHLPRSVQTLQVGGLLNAFGNGVVYPFLFIYLHNVHGFATGTVGLILATNGAVSLVAGPLSGSMVDRFGGRRTLTGALIVLTLGYGSYAFVTEPWHGFLASVGAGIGNGAFWPAQSSLLAGLTPAHQRPAAWGMQRVTMNLGFGLGVVSGGLIASTSDPTTFKALFLVDAATFVGYAVVLNARVPEVRPERAADGAPGRYADVLRHRVFIAVLALNSLFITAGFAQLELLPAYMKNEAGVSEKGVGLVFFVNTIVIVAAQLPVTKLAGGRRRMRLLTSLGATWALAWLLTPLVGTLAAGATATVLFALTQGIFAFGECLHGAVHGPLVADLAAPGLTGRYMALSAFSWQLGFTIGPAIGGFLLGFSPNGLWLVAAAGCASAGVIALALERAIPREARRSPLRAEPAPALAAELQ
jgi:MFS family permease